MHGRSKTWKLVFGLAPGVWSWTSAVIAPQNARVPLSYSIRRAQVKAGLSGQTCKLFNKSCVKPPFECLPCKAEEGGWCPYGLVGDMKSDYYQRHLDADFIKAMKNSSLFMPAAQEDAKNRGMKVKDYLKSVLDLADKFSISDESVDREEFIEAIQDAIQTNRLTLIVGGKSVGKSTIVERLVRKIEEREDNKSHSLVIRHARLSEQGLFRSRFDRGLQGAIAFEESLECNQGLASSHGKLPSKPSRRCVFSTQGHEDQGKGSDPCRTHL